MPSSYRRSARTYGEEVVKALKKALHYNRSYLGPVMTGCLGARSIEACAPQKFCPRERAGSLWTSCYEANMDVADYYQTLAGRRAAIMAACISDESTFTMHVASHNALKDFELILGVISGPERTIFMQACREYQYSLEAVAFGHYRHAFSSLRLAFELFTATMYFSANQMKMHLWLQGHDDLQWATLTDPDKGVYSHNFMRAFYPALGPYRSQYYGLASAVYRECSEYVHGNPGTHEDTMLVVAYDPKRSQNFHDKVATVRLCVIFQFVSRYLLELGDAGKEAIEPLALEAFGDLPEIQSTFGATGK